MGRGAEPPFLICIYLPLAPSSSLSCCLVVASMAPTRRFSPEEKGKAPQALSEAPPPKRGHGRPRKSVAAPATSSRGRGLPPLAARNDLNNGRWASPVRVISGALAAMAKGEGMTWPAGRRACAPARATRRVSSSCRWRALKALDFCFQAPSRRSCRQWDPLGYTAA